MYDFLFNPLYLNMFILALLIFLVFFFWRKLTILEGNFYILEKRVNLIKRENRDSNIVKNAEHSNTVMNEIFGGCISPDNCSKMGVCSILPSSSPLDEKDTINIVSVVSKIDLIQPEIPNVINESDEVKISFNTDDLDKKIEEIIEPIDIVNIIEKKVDIDIDNVSSTSDITFNVDDKYTSKKLSKMNHDKLKEVCLQLNLNSEGTKAQLISRILETNK